MIVSTEIINKRYMLIEKLGAGGMGAVYRVSDQLTGQTVALKSVITPIENSDGTPSSESTDLRLALSREFRTLASLRHPHIVTVIDYGFADQQPYFTMHLVENARTLFDATREQSETEKVRLLVELLQALVYLHRRGVLHRDLKPGNVLVDASNMVKMLDFGLSLASSHSISNMQSGMSGTLAYMAPELFLEESASSVASDLYAFGVVAFELFAGIQPFSSKNIGLLINSILSTQPDWSPIDPRLMPVLQRLLDKNPKNRYASAEETMRALCAAMNYPLPRETAAIRESFLQTAPLVGRQGEFSHLHEALKAAINGQGSIYLVGGESGVGKSRLMDELRIRALVRGVLVLRGQSVSDGNTPYHVWRDILRLLVLNTSLSDEEAAVLKSVVPDIERLLQREVWDAPELPDAEQTQMRLFHVVEALLRRQTQPVLVLLEDLQWAGSESLALISYLSGLVSSLPLMMVGDYRDDESPNLPQMLHYLPAIKLKRLSPQETAELAAAMLGEAGTQKEVLDLLHRETEGNAFFLVEVVRALAEEAGQLGEIGRTSLPRKVLAGGIRSVIERRLMRVGDEARALLKMAAVIGYRLDLDVLTALAPDVDLDAWLTDCANAAIVDVHDEKWHFAHSKLREFLLDGISDNQRIPLFRQIAEAIEAAHTNMPDYAPTLAHLWQVVGDDQREFNYTQMAGLQAFQANASAEAIPYLTRALELMQSLPESPERTQQELPLQISLSVALMHTRGFTTPEVEESWLRSRRLCEDLNTPADLVAVMFGLCGIYTMRGQHDRGLAMDQQIIEMAPQTPYPHITLMEAHYTTTASLMALGRIKEAYEATNEILKLYDPADAQLAIQMYGGNPGNTAKVWSAFLLQLLGYPDQAIQRFDLALKEAHELGHPFSLSTSMTFAWIHQVRREPLKALELVREGNALANEYGFTFNQILGAPVHGWALAQVGRAEEGIGILEQSLGMMLSMGAIFLRKYFLSLLADCYMTVSNYGKASEVLTEAMNPEKTVDHGFESEIYRMWGELLLKQGGDTSEAEQYFLKALAFAQGHEMRLMELRSSVSLARLWRSQAKTAEAREHLSQIYNWFTEGFDTVDLKEAKALLSELA